MVPVHENLSMLSESCHSFSIEFLSVEQIEMEYNSSLGREKKNTWKIGSILNKNIQRFRNKNSHQ